MATIRTVLRVIEDAKNKYILLHEEPWTKDTSVSVAGEVFILKPAGQAEQSFMVEQVIRDEKRWDIYYVVAKGGLTGPQIQALREAS